MITAAILKNESQKYQPNLYLRDLAINKFLLDYFDITSCFLNCYKIYIYRDNTRRHHYIA